MPYRPPLIHTEIPDGHQEEYINSKQQDENGIYHVEYGYCPECYASRYINDYHRGELVCPVCGLVLQEYTEMQEPTKSEHIPQRSNTSEKEFIKQNKLKIPDWKGSKESRKAYTWRIISTYASRIGLPDVDKQNIYNFMTKENLNPIRLKRHKIALAIIKYIQSDKKYFDNRINRGIYKEEGLTQKEYKRTIKYLFQHDKYGIVKEKDKNSNYYKWVYE